LTEWVLASLHLSMPQIPGYVVCTFQFFRTITHVSE